MISYEVPEGTDLEKMEIVNYEGIDTMTKAFDRTVKRIPNNDMYGTRNGDKYEWMSFKEVHQ